MILKSRLKEVLEQRGMTQKQLCELTGLRPNTVSEMAKNTRDSINRRHFAIVAQTLDITDIRELLVLDEE